MVVYLLRSFISLRGYSLLRNKNKGWSQVNTGARRVRILHALSLRLPSLHKRFSKQPSVARTDWLNHFWDIHFKRFILQLFHIKPVFKRLSVFSTRMFLYFIPRLLDSAWGRARSWSAKKRGKKSYERCKPLNPKLPTPLRLQAINPLRFLFPYARWTIS